MRLNNKGLAWIWIVAIIAIVSVTITWYIESYVANIIMDALEPYIPEQYRGTMTILRYVIAVFPLLFCFGILLWAYARSSRPQEVSYPFG